jgi:hypothetical protein
MADKPRGAKVGKFVEVPPDVHAAVLAMCERWGTTYTFELVDALRRHTTYPPKRVPEPLPDADPEPLPDSAKKARRGKAK